MSTIRFDYGAWVTEQAGRIVEKMREVPPFTDLAVWVVPSKPGKPGYLVTSTQKPDEATDVVRFGPHGSTVLRVPYSHVRGLLWDACRSFPILPIGSDA